MEVCSHNQLDPNTVLLKINGTACNLCCHYCSEITKRKNSRMPLEYIRTIFENLPKDTSIILHGGEPLLDAEYIRAIIELFHSLREGKIFIQTNGCFDKEMLRVLIENKQYIKIGISLDGPGEQSAYRTMPNGETSFETVDALLDKLCDYGIDVKCIATIHNLNYKNPDMFLKYFLSKKNITQLRINPCFDVNTNGLAHYAITPSHFFSFLEKILFTWISKSLFSKIRIDPIHAAFEQALTGEYTQTHHCSKFISIYSQNQCTLCDSLGDISFSCNDWTQLFFQATLFANARLQNECTKCQYTSRCEYGCIAIMNRFKKWKSLSEEYCKYRRNFFLTIRKMALEFCEK